MTHKVANKGAVMECVSRYLQESVAVIAALPRSDVPQSDSLPAIRSHPNHVHILNRSCLILPMHNPSHQLQNQASVNLDSYNHEVFFFFLKHPAPPKLYSFPLPTPLPI